MIMEFKDIPIEELMKFDNIEIPIFQLGLIPDNELQANMVRVFCGNCASRREMGCLLEYKIRQKATMINPNSKLGCFVKKG